MDEDIKTTDSNKQDIIKYCKSLPLEKEMVYKKEVSDVKKILANKKYSIYVDKSESEIENVYEKKLYICRLDYSCEDNENECPFCKLNRSNKSNIWYAKCGLYQKRLKQFSNKDIAICCDECIKDIRENK